MAGCITPEGVRLRGAGDIPHREGGNLGQLELPGATPEPTTVSRLGSVDVLPVDTGDRVDTTVELEHEGGTVLHGLPFVDIFAPYPGRFRV